MARVVEQTKTIKIKKIKEILGVLTLVHIVFLAIVLVRLSGTLVPLEILAYDFFVRFKGNLQDREPRIAIVTIDDSEYSAWGYPLSDETIAQLIEKVLSAGPRAVGLDIYRDRPVGEGIRELEQLLRTNRNVIVVYKRAAGERSGVLPPPVLADTDQVGFADIMTDPGGIVRRGLLFMDDGQSYATAFSLRLALRYLETHDIGMRPDRDNPQNLRLGETTLVPFEAHDGGYRSADASGYQFLLDFAGGPTPFDTISMSEVMDGLHDPERIRDKIVIIGSAADSVKDFFYTPYSASLRSDQAVFGTTIHAHTISQLLRAALDGDKPTTSLSEGSEIAWIWIWALIGGAIGVTIRSPWRFAFICLAGVLVLFSASLLAFLAALWIPLVPASLTWFVSAAILSAHAARQEKLQRTLLMQTFSRYVSKDFADEIWRHRDDLLEGGRPKSQILTATVLFSDLEGFTSVSERESPESLLNWLNEYMDSMAEQVMSHGGVVDKYIGDAVMAVFGVPFPSETEQAIREDAVSAARCALKMGDAIRELNKRGSELGAPQIGVRIGICTGPVIAGSLGSADRMQYTVLGDTVNTAARLESLGKDFKDLQSSEESCLILIAETVKGYLGTAFETVEIGSVNLKGKETPISVYRLLGEVHHESAAEKAQASPTA
jgi:adenylate cyclase